jgi:hypothetical protein
LLIWLIRQEINPLAIEVLEPYIPLSAGDSWPFQGSTNIGNDTGPGTLKVDQDTLPDLAFTDMAAFSGNRGDR